MFNILKHILILFFLITPFNCESTASSQHCGISIEESFWGQVEHQRGLRVLLFDTEEQRAIEVNHYAPIIKDKVIVTGIHVLNPDEHSNRNPLKAFILTATTEKGVVVSSDFNANLYTVVSQFPLYKLKDPLTNLSTLTVENCKTLLEPVPAMTALYGNRPQYIYVASKNPIGSGQLKDKFDRWQTSNSYIKYNPIFRLIDMMQVNPPRMSSFLGEVLLEKGEEEKDYSWGKEKLGEMCGILSLLSYGYRHIYDAKIAGMFGFDIIFASGVNPSQDELFIAEAKWTCHTHAPQTFLEKELRL